MSYDEYEQIISWRVILLCNRSDNQSYSQSLSMLQMFDPVEVLMSHTMEGRVLHTKVKAAAGTNGNISGKSSLPGSMCHWLPPCCWETGRAILQFTFSCFTKPP